MWTLADNDFAEIAESFGVTALWVDSPGELQQAISSPFATQRALVLESRATTNVLAKRVPH